MTILITTAVNYLIIWGYDSDNEVVLCVLVYSRDVSIITLSVQCTPIESNGALVEPHLCVKCHHSQTAQLLLTIDLSPFA